MKALRARWQALCAWLTRLRADLRERHALAAENLVLRRQLRLYLGAKEERRQHKERMRAWRRARRAARERGEGDGQP